VRQRLPWRVVGTIGNTTWPGTKQLSLRTMVSCGTGELQKLWVLDDTGAQVNLVNRKLFTQELFYPAKKPVNLRSISGDKVGGGGMITNLKIGLTVEDWWTGERWEQCLAAEFYVADIDNDIILGWLFLYGHWVGVLPHRKKLLWELGEDWAWLSGCLRNPDHLVQCDRVVAAQVRQLSLPHSWKAKDYALRPELVEKVVQDFGGEIPVLEAFATNDNKWGSKFWDITDDAFSKTWGSFSGLFWINTPFQTLDRMVENLKEDQGRAILIVPRWPSKK